MNRRFFLGVLCLTTCAFGQAQESAPTDWPQWRGPRGDGVSHEKGWRATFGDDGPKKLWEAKVGRGFSSPALRDGRLYLLSTTPGDLSKETVHCFEAETGKEIWTYHYELQSIKRGSNPAGGTPALAGELVFSYGAGLTLVALNAKTGQMVWTNDVMKDLPGQPTPYGFQLSPTPFENLVIVPALTNQKNKTFNGPWIEPRAGPYATTGGVLLAFDQKSGKEVWRNTEGASAWSSPMIAKVDGKVSLVHLTGRYILGVEPRTGTTLWKIDLRTVGIRAEDMAASPVIVGDVIVAPIHQAFGSVAEGSAGSAAFEVKNGQAKLLWKNSQWCHWFQSAAEWGGHLYAFDERNTCWCLDLKTGQEKWRSKDLGPSGRGGGAFMIADGKMLAIDGRHTLRTVDLAPTGPRVLSKAVIFASQAGFECETAPVLLNGLLYCRNHTQLLCFDLRTPSR